MQGRRLFSVVSTGALLVLALIAALFWIVPKPDETYTGVAGHDNSAIDVEETVQPPRVPNDAHVESDRARAIAESDSEAGKVNEPVDDKSPTKFQHKQHAYLLFDYSEMPEGATGTLQVYGYKDEALVLWFEKPLEARVEKSRRMKEGAYRVMIVGKTVWCSDPIHLAEREQKVVVLQPDEEQAVSVTVVDDDTGEPIKDAALTLASHRTPGSEVESVPGILALSDGNGLAVLQGQPIAKLPYRVEKFGYIPMDFQSGMVARGEYHLGTARLKRATGEITVSIDMSGVDDFVAATVSLEDPADRFTSVFQAAQEVERNWLNHPVLKKAVGEVKFTKLVPGRRYILVVSVETGREKQAEDQTEAPYVRLKSGNIINNDAYPGNEIHLTSENIRWQK
jgi:hypothetical protein